MVEINMFNGPNASTAKRQLDISNLVDNDSQEFDLGISSLSDFSRKGSGTFDPGPPIISIGPSGGSAQSTDYLV